MARLQRIPSHGGIHYVLLAGDGWRPIFSDDSDREELSGVLALHAGRCGARVHAYCWTSSDARLVIETSGVSLKKVIHGVATRYAKSMNRKLGRTGRFFHDGHYLHADLNGQFRLLELVRHVHLTPVLLGLVADAAQYRWCSHRAYLALDAVPWVTTELIFQMLDASSARARNAYRLFMAGRVTCDWQRQGRSSTALNRPGDAKFMSWLRRQSAQGLISVTVDEIMRAVCVKLEVDPAQLRSPSHSRLLTLARGLISWHAIRADVVSLSDVAKRFDRDPSTVYTAIDRYRKRRPELFNEPLDDLLAHSRGIFPQLDRSSRLQSSAGIDSCSHPVGPTDP
jgi:putative transposase